MCCLFSVVEFSHWLMIVMMVGELLAVIVCVYGWRGFILNRALDDVRISIIHQPHLIANNVNHIFITQVQQQRCCLFNVSLFAGRAFSLANGTQRVLYLSSCLLFVFFLL